VASVGLADRLYVPRATALHGIPAHVKLVAMVLFIFAVIATPNEQFWAFGCYALIVIGIIGLSRVPVTVIAPRMLIEVPFVIFALLMPFFGPEPYVRFIGLQLSEPGLIAGFGIFAKATIGVTLSILLAATTTPRDLLGGLETLRVPALLVQIAGFMVRYVQVVVDELHRMRIARESRGFQARGVRAWPVLAQSVGTLFIRSYERGERVHLAMLSRGYTGRLPHLVDIRATRQQWFQALLVPVSGAVVMVLALWAQS